MPTRAAPLTACRHVTCTKIRHGGYSGALRDDGGIADLQGERVYRVRTVPQRLAMTADGANIFLLDARLLDYGVGGVGEQFAERHVHLTQSINFIGAGVHQRLDIASGLRWNRVRMGPDEFRFALCGQGDQYGIDPVNAGS